MIILNLISKDDKENLKWERINKVALSYALKIIMIEILFMATLVATVAYLKYEKDIAAGELALVESTKETVEIKEMENNLKKYEKNLKAVSGIHQDHIRWIEVIDSFSSMVPGGIKINSIRFKPFEKVSGKKGKGGAKVETDESKYMLEVRGVALKREDLMEFEKKLTGASIFKIIENKDPSYNKYVKSEKIEFTFNFEVPRADLAGLANK